MSDRLLGGACLALAAFYIFYAMQTQIGFMSDPMGPRAFPVVIGIVLALAGIYPILRPDPEPNWPALGKLLEIIFAVAVMIAYTYALPEFGFTISTAFAAGLLSWRLGAHPAGAAIAGVTIAVGIFVIFRLVLKLSLAVGPWGF
ncbi:MAG: tripartite tricarboxylate transporter TctB family protein [Salaquimonas sp.]|nr:tripartite tricarboxylate transporter TctB family protein [Salaquimonas sp.]